MKDYCAVEYLQLLYLRIVLQYPLKNYLKTPGTFTLGESFQSLWIYLVVLGTMIQRIKCKKYLKTLAVLQRVYVCISGSKTCQFFGKLCELTKSMIPKRNEGLIVKISRRKDCQMFSMPKRFIKFGYETIWFFGGQSYICYLYTIV